MITSDSNKFDVKKWYLSNYEVFETKLNGKIRNPFSDVRKQAILKFADLDFPDTHNEEWKYTNIAPILKHKFQLATKPHQVTQFDLAKYLYKDLKSNILVVVNGQYSHEFSKISVESDGLIIESLKEALISHPEIIQKYLGKVAKFETETFTALNTAFTDDGILIYIPKETRIEQPIHIINISVPDEGTFIAHPRNLVVVEEGSEVKIINGHHFLTEDTYFNNIVTEIVVEENAHLDFVKIQEESDSSFHIANTQIQQARSSVCSSVNIDLGGALVRNNLNYLLEDQNCESNMYGFYLGRGKQHIDNHTFMDHAEPHCKSNEMYKGILDDQATAVFNGKILVRPDAQKTNALQSNKTLLLTNEASINAKPQLEIFADDVKCTHGATIGQLDEEALFYLRARGIGKDSASAMLRYAFAADVFDKIKIDSVREKLNADLHERLK